MVIRMLSRVNDYIIQCVNFGFQDTFVATTTQNHLPLCIPRRGAVFDRLIYWIFLCLTQGIHWHFVLVRKPNWIFVYGLGQHHDALCEGL
jgi:hypothetical protein